MASFQCYSNCCHLLAVYMCALLHTSARTIQRYNIKRYLNLHSLALWSVDCKLALSLLEISINLYLFACWWKPNWLASLFGSSGLSFSYLIQSHISVWPGGKSQSWKVFFVFIHSPHTFHHFLSYHSMCLKSFRSYQHRTCMLREMPISLLASDCCCWCSCCCLFVPFWLYLSYSILSIILWDHHKNHIDLFHRHL